ncbi:hypothetical protein HPB51_011081 [Rhipicephalus microplus]|uniref:Citrate transporter-like domain-containing protein n=1 Tax=Rhipicephalus microplus TaxID=6941 RepID=A0A9J6DUT1_RHIMP|nr:hypothetical protein HPB51_011081 [Rhipicephalus microplus]
MENSSACQVAFQADPSFSPLTKRYLLLHFPTSEEGKCSYMFFSFNSLVRSFKCAIAGTHAGWIAILGALLLLVLADLDDLESVMARVEWTTLVFFAALFVVMEALGELQLIYFIGQRTQEWIGALQPQSQRPVAILIVTWVSALASSLMDNIPFTTAMVKVVTGLSEGPSLVYALAVGSLLGRQRHAHWRLGQRGLRRSRRATRPPVHLLRLLQACCASPKFHVVFAACWHLAAVDESTLHRDGDGRGQSGKTTSPAPLDTKVVGQAFVSRREQHSEAASTQQLYGVFCLA